ncbi:MAG TPA: CPBP family intramembrane metalloprotease [Bacillota bacterium]|nr:CPBP family intramembrane metalloprotease [Bacillota bacterium]
MTALTYVLLGISLVVRLFVSSEACKRNDATDATTSVVFLSLISAGIIHRGDPLDIYGLSLSSLFRCSWTAIFLLWATAFTIGRVANALILHPGTGFEEMLARGHASPGGVYLSLKDYPNLCGLMLGVPMIWSQTFMEEFIFRGLLVSLGKWFYGLLGISEPFAGFLSIIGSAIMFGLVHFVPAFYRLRGKSILIPLYAFIMPTTLGMIFSLLNRVSYSLWSGWIVHFGLNYAGFMWDRISGKWEAYGPA